MMDRATGKPPESPFGVRLRAARKMAGLSMEDLAKRLGGMVTKQAIGKYEKGLMMPTPAVLERLVDVLRLATWGASPVGDAGAEIAQRTLFDEAEAPAMPAGGGPLHFLRKRRAGRPKSEAEAHRFAIHVESPADASATDRESSDPRTPASGRPDRFAALAERRARYLMASLEAPALPAAAAIDALPPAADPGAAPALGASAPGPEKIRFREGEKLPAKSAAALRYRLADYLERCLGLEALLGTGEPFANPITGLPVHTPEDVETAAEEVRRRWDLGSGPVVNLLGVLDERGIRVFETSGIDGFEGLSGAFGELPFVAVSRDVPADRLRFTAAHELAHVLCDFHERDEAEGACHEFAAAFLLPKSAAERAFGRPGSKVTLGGLAEIKTAYGISLQAIMRRARGLGLVTERQYRSFRETVKARGWGATEPVAYEGVERATRFRRLVHYAVASGILDVERAAVVAGVGVEELRSEIGDVF